MENANENKLKIKEIWNQKAEKYTKDYAKQNLDIIAALCSLAKVYSNKTSNSSIIEVGCGPGEGTRFLSSFCPKPFILYSCDYSPNMLSYAIESFKNYTDFNLNPTNHFEVITPQFKENIKINVQEDNKVLMSQNKETIVKLFEGDAESLPFEDNQFDTYISPLCLMITDYHKSLKEAYRILKTDGRIAIGIWGKRSDTTCRIIEEIVIKYGFNVPSFKLYRMGENEDELKALCKSIGFKDVRISYMNNYKNDNKESIEDDMYCAMDKDIKRQMIELEGKDKEKASKILNEIKETIHQTKTLKRFNVLCLTAFK